MAIKVLRDGCMNLRWQKGYVRIVKCEGLVSHVSGKVGSLFEEKLTMTSQPRIGSSGSRSRLEISQECD